MNMTYAHLVIVRDPFRPQFNREMRVLPRRRRIAVCAPNTSQPVICLLNGVPLLRKDWARTRVKRGDVVAFVLLPQGGGGGSNPLKTILQIAVMVAAPQLAVGLLGTGAGATLASAMGGTDIFLGVTGAVIGLAGNALINSVLPPPRLPGNQQAAALAAPSPTYSLPGQQGNQARIGQAIPVLYGRHVIYPDYAAMPFYEFLGNEQYGHFLFCLGQGELLIEQVRFDKTDASAYGGDVVMEVVPPGGTVSLFPTNVVTSSEVSGQELVGRKDVTYSQSGSTVTVTETAHGRAVGNIVKLNITARMAGVEELPIATVVDANTWTVTWPAALTASGAVQVYSCVGGTGFVVNQGGTLANQICVDVVMPSGIGVVNTTTGAIDAAQVRFYVEVQAIDTNGVATGPWLMLPPLNPPTPVSHSVSVTQAKSTRGSYNYATRGYNYSVTLTVINLGHTGVVSSSVVVKRGGVVFSGWSLIVGAGPGGVDQIAVGNQTAPAGAIAWTVGYRVNTTEFEEVINGATNTPQRRSLIYAVAPDRYKARVTRTDVKNTSAQAFHTLNWVALEGYIPGTQNYGEVTMMAMRIRASAMTATAAQRVNVIATRCLPRWDAVKGWTTQPEPTTSIAWALADAARAQYGGRQTDAQIDLTKLVELDALWQEREDEFNGIFDNSISLWEAFTSILRAGRAKPLQIGGVLTTVRDQAQPAPVALFSMRNIERGSFALDYVFPSAATTDSVEVTYFDRDVWAQRTVMCTLPGDTANNPAKVNAFGITQRDQAHREGIYMAASNRYRRKIARFRTEMDGFIPVYGDSVAVQHDVPGWGQHAEVVGYDANTALMTLSEVFEWTANAQHYLGFRNRDGSLTAAVRVTQGSTADSVILMDPLPTPYLDIGTARERTHVSFGPGDTWRQRMIVTAVTPRGMEHVEITCAAENPLVHTLENTVPTPPWVGW